MKTSHRLRSSACHVGRPALYVAVRHWLRRHTHANWQALQRAAST